MQSLFAILQYLVAEINYMTIILFHPVGSHYYKQKNPVFLSKIEEIALILAILPQNYDLIKHKKCIISKYITKFGFLNKQIYSVTLKTYIWAYGIRKMKL